MRSFTITEKENGELACRNLSEKAKEVYDGTDPLDVYEYVNSDGNKVYAYTGCYGNEYDLSFEELQENLEGFYRIDETDVRNRLIELIENNSYIEADGDDYVMFPEAYDVKSFEDAHICTIDEGVVIELSNGTRIYLTIQVC